MNLDENDIPHKTKKGQEELTLKSDNISVHLRRSLLFVDGKRNFKELFRLTQTFGGKESFVELLNMKMITLHESGDNIEQQSLINLHELVTKALQEIYGVGITKEIEKIAKKYPPECHGEEFLNACRNKALMLMSESKVDTIFTPIFEKIRS